MDYKLKDKVVLINGSTGGIGQALARAFAAEGCKLALSSPAQDKLDAFIPTLDIAPARSLEDAGAHCLKVPYEIDLSRMDEYVGKILIPERKDR